MEQFDVNPPGSADAFGGDFDHTTNQIVPDAAGIIGTITILDPTISEVDAALAGVTVGDTWSAGSGSFNSASFDYQIAVNYTVATIVGSAPEPATLALMGSALLGLGLLSRFRRR